MDLFSIRVQDRTRVEVTQTSFGGAEMKNAKWMLTMAMILTLMPGLAAAQMSNTDKIVAQVPFNFRVGDRIVPAGECTIQAATMTSKTMVIRNVGARKSLLSTLKPAEMAQAAAANSLTFHKYGERYFLSEIHIEGSRTAYRLPLTGAEAELRAQSVPATNETLMASLR
jgi:hypothetical protein